MNDIKKIRNIGIIAHIDAGKTTTTERVLYYTGKAYKIGEVDEGTTIMDFSKDEQLKGITISSAATTCMWKDHTINLIDTPGHIDFTVEVERSLRVLDGAVGIFCAVGGVEAQSETVWRQANRYQIPRIAFVNKMDRTGANFAKVLESMRSKLQITPVALTIPWGCENNFCGVIDILRMKALVFEGKSGNEVVETDIPGNLQQQAKNYYDKLIDSLADFDDEIIEKFSVDALYEEDLINSLRQATLAGNITPVFVGASKKNKGVQCLLDGIVSYLPSPQDRPPIVGTHPKTEKSICYRIDENKLCALAFKTTFSKYGTLTFVRIYTGKLNEGMQVYNPLQEKSERINRICTIHANQLLKREHATPGDIVGIIGLKHTVTGDTLCQKKNPIVLEHMQIPETVVSKTIEPKVTANKDNLVEILKILGKDDPTFRTVVDEDSGQIIISGMGELHLDIIYNRIQDDHHIDIKLGKPKVSYRETINSIAEGEHRLQKQFAGREHFAYIRVRVEPCKEGLEIGNALASGTIPKIFIPAIEESLRSAMSSGELAGYPLINVKATIVKAESHAVHSSEMAFNNAAFMATKDALCKAGYVLLEPIMYLQIQTPVSYVGDVISDLNCRRAEVTEMELQENIEIITAKAPLAEMFGYSNDLRTLTQGRATYTMAPLEYSTVSRELQEKLVY